MKLQDRIERLVEREIYCHVGGLIDKMQEYANEASQFEAMAYEFTCEPTDEQVAEYIEDNTTDDYTPDESDAYGELQFPEVFEYWAVSEWLARKLREQGEPVAEFGLTHVWGRGTTGQAIALDYVIEKIVKDNNYAMYQ